MFIRFYRFVTIFYRLVQIRCNTNSDFYFYLDWIWTQLDWIWTIWWGQL